MAKNASGEAWQEFVFRVRDPSVSYSFSIQHDRRRLPDEPFTEWLAVNFITDCLWPERFANRKGKATIRPEPALADHQHMREDDLLRRSFGFVHATKNVFEIVVWLPPAVCWELGAAMSSGLVSSMLTNGRVEPRGMVKLTHASFEGPDFDPVAYIG